jgi:uncharacterized protein YjbI with pentapeptide repeats
MSSLYVDVIRNKSGAGAPEFDRGIVISGILTATGSIGGNSVGIGSTTVVNPSFQLQNILSLDSTTLATFESALEVAPNNFNSLYVTGIGTIIQLNVTDYIAGAGLSISDYSELQNLSVSGLSTLTTLSGQRLYYSGISTAQYLNGLSYYYSGISTAVALNGTNLYYTGITTAINLRSITLNSTGVSTVTYLQGTNLNYSGISTITNLSASSVTGTSLTATNANITNLSASSITGTSLTATNATLTSLTVNTAISTTSNVQTLNAVSVASTTLDGDSIVGLAATITNLTSTSFGTQSATIGVGTATVFNPTTLNSTNVNTRNVSSVGVITSTEFHTGAAATSIRILSDRITGPSEIVIDPAATGTTGRVRIAGDLYVDGEQFYVSSTAIELADFNVGIATTVATNALLDGAGIGIGSTGIRKTITWNNSASALTSSEDWNIASGKVYEINGTQVLSSTTLGSGVTQSSLTSLGTLGSLSVSGNISAGGVNAGLSTITTLGGTSLNYPSAFVRTGIITNSSGSNLSYTGLSTVTNIRGSSLEYSGISTVTNIRGTTLSYSGISTVTDINGSNLSYSGLSTVTHLRGTTLQYTGVSTFSHVNSTTLVSGASTFTGNVTLNSGNEFRINSTSVLSSTTLGTGVTFSSLRSVGTLNQLSVSGVSTFSGAVRFGGLVSEKLNGEISNTGAFGSGGSYSAVTNTLTIDVSAGTVLAGDPGGTVDVWAFTNVPTTSGNMITCTLILEGDTADFGTGQTCTINGSPITIYWVNGTEPVATASPSVAFDVITFRICRDDSAVYRIFGSYGSFY